MAQSGAKFIPTARQRAVAELLADPQDRRSKTKKLEQAGVPRRTFYHWMENPEFVKYLGDVVALYTDSELPEVWRALIGQCTRGDTSAIKLFFEMKGLYTQRVKTDATVNVKKLEDLI